MAEITGTVTKVIRRKTAHGSVFVTMDIERNGSTARLRFLKPFGELPVKGDTVTITGVPMVGYKQVNIGSVRITKGV